MHQFTGREARPRRYLMCPPSYFEVRYSINPWMHPDQPVDTGRVMAQWQTLVDCYLHLGHKVDMIDPIPGLPDMVFTANGATVIGDRALTARFRNPERAAEAPAFLEWFRHHGCPAARASLAVNEGEGDHLVTADRLLAGSGFRSDRGGHPETREFFDRPVLGLELVDPRFYHLDTALAVLDEDTGEIMYYPPAFSAQTRTVLRQLYPDAIRAGDADALAFGLNAVSDGRNVVLAAAATGLAAQLRERGFRPIGIDLTELLKSGGGAKCCTLELHDAGRTNP